jgi:hypothetical protein
MTVRFSPAVAVTLLFFSPLLRAQGVTLPAGTPLPVQIGGPLPMKAGMSSAASIAGESIEATVAEPVRNPDGSIAVPQGSILMGTITEAQPARSFARAGKLRFNFRQIQ